MKSFLRQVVKEVTVMVIFAAAFSLLFIAGHLALYQEWPRWK